MSKYRILVVDDEVDLCEILRFNLENEGYSVDVSHSAEEALKRELSAYHLLLLDVMMGEISGYNLAAKLKREEPTAHIPIIFLTARDTENDKLTGFNIGAEDYISKPFSVREVLMRVKVVLRRIKLSEENNDSQSLLNEEVTYEDLRLNAEGKQCFIDNRPISLTRKEFDILVVLLNSIDRVVSREELLDSVWKEEAFVLDRTIDVNIARLRKKIEKYGSHIVAKTGFGYCFRS